MRQIVGPKTLVIDPSLAGPLGLVTEVSTLKVSCVLHCWYEQADQSSVVSWRGSHVLLGAWSSLTSAAKHRLPVFAKDQFDEDHSWSVLICIVSFSVLSLLYWTQISPCITFRSTNK